MFTSLRLRDFKNFADERLRMGPFTVIVGANASGKSNIRDAFRFLHGIGRGYTLADILGGKCGAGGQVEWEEIRGAPAEIIRYGQDSMYVDVDLGRPMFTPVNTYGIGIDRAGTSGGAFRVVRETFSLVDDFGPGDYLPIYTSAPPHPDPVAAQDDEHHLLKALMAEYADRPMDFADATLVRVAERLSTNTIFTIDHNDFETYRAHGRSFEVTPSRTHCP